MRVSTSISLPLELVERLEEEDNKSAVVREALEDHYGMEDYE